jgi:restriction system protein
MDITFHFHPDLFNLLVDTIPRLNRSKKDTLLFFIGAGIDESVTGDIQGTLNSNPESISKFEIARTVLRRLNEQGEVALRLRREVLTGVGLSRPVVG